MIDEIAFDLQYCALEFVGAEFIRDPEKPSFKSDVFSFGGVTFLVQLLSFCISILTVSRFSRGKYHGKEKAAYQISKERSKKKKLSPARSHNILDNQWNLIARSWSWNPEDRLDSTDVFITTKYFIIPRNVVTLKDYPAKLTGIRRRLAHSYEDVCQLSVTIVCDIPYKIRRCSYQI